MINNPNMLEETLENFNKIPAEVIKESIKEVTMNDKEAIEQLKNILKNTENILKPLDEETPEEVKAFQKMQFKNYNAIETVLNLIQTQQEEIEKKDKIIKMLTDEREYIKNNLEVDLNRKGVFSQSKGQISQILECYKNNDEYFEKKAEEKK